MATNKPEVGAYYKHQDGGFYRVTGIAKNTDDGSEMVVYEHLYPFPSQLYARPVNQWSAVRFQMTNLERLIHFRNTHEREEYQDVVNKARAARKRRECLHPSSKVRLLYSCASHFVTECQCGHKEIIDKD